MVSPNTVETSTSPCQIGQRIKTLTGVIRLETHIGRSPGIDCEIASNATYGIVGLYMRMTNMIEIRWGGLMGTVLAITNQEMIPETTWWNLSKEVKNRTHTLLRLGDEM